MFSDRLKQAAHYAGVDYSPTAIGRSLSVSKQTVHAWMTNGEPRPAMVFHIADSWNIDPRWLATGEGSMHQPPSSGTMSADEVEMIKRFRKTEPRQRASLLAVAKTFAKVATVIALAGGSTGFDNKSFARASSPIAGANYTLRRLLGVFRSICFSSLAF